MLQCICKRCCVVVALQGDAPEGVVSPTASFAGAALSVRGGGLGSRGSAEAPAAESQPQSETQSRPQTRSGSQEAEAEPSSATDAAPSAANSAAVASGMSCVDDMEGADVEAGLQDLTWGNGTGSSELSALGMTKRSVSSKSGTRRRKVRADMQGGASTSMHQTCESLALQAW